jgi:phosphatidate cytidylyltransferase
VLKQRVATAVTLLLLLLGSLAAAERMWFELLILALVGAGTWEWLRLCKTIGRAALIAAAAFGAGLFWFWLSAPRSWQLALLAVSCGGWLLWALPALARGLPAAEAWGMRWLEAFGLLALGACYVAIELALREHGALYLVSMLALVWVADIAAYFVGRAIGRHKLAPSISPGKTWEGAAGGWVAVLAYGAILAGPMAAALPHSYPAVLQRSYGFAGFAVVMSLLCVLSVAGDLFESMLKRHAGVKDSSGLLPGHGGVLDRIDALLPVAPFAVLLAG